MASYQEVKKELDKLSKEAQRLLKVEVKGVIKKIKAMMADYGLTPADLIAEGKKYQAARAAKTKKALPPKYRDPQTGATWSGRGRAPGWLAEAMKSGKVDAYVIQAGGSAAASKPKKAQAAKQPAAAKKVSPAQKAEAKKSAVKKPVAKKVAAKKAVVPKATVPVAPSAAE